MKKKVAKGLTALAAAAAVIVIALATALCAVFPNKYSTEINAAADEFGLDPVLVRSVVWAESKFDRRAVSDKGAQGLMQLMPKTFDMCAAALYIKDADPFDAETSLRCGCYYLSLLADSFDDERAALMAYNAGEKNARLFLNGERIFPETEKYLKDISLAKKVYGLFD